MLHTAAEDHDPSQGGPRSLLESLECLDRLTRCLWLKALLICQSLLSLLSERVVEKSTIVWEEKRGLCSFLNKECYAGGFLLSLLVEKGPRSRRWLLQAQAQCESWRWSSNEGIWGTIQVCLPWTVMVTRPTLGNPSRVIPATYELVDSQSLCLLWSI